MASHLHCSSDMAPASRVDFSEGHRVQASMDIASCRLQSDLLSGAISLRQSISQQAKKRLTHHIIPDSHNHMTYYRTLDPRDRKGNCGLVVSHRVVQVKLLILGEFGQGKLRRLALGLLVSSGSSGAPDHKRQSRHVNPLRILLDDASLRTGERAACFARTLTRK